MMSTAGPEHVPPTLIPTIDPSRVPDLLRNAFSVKTWPGVIRYQIRQITGWDYGYGGGFLYTSCSGYSWLDTNHLLLYPATGQVDSPEGWSPTKFNVVRQPVVINLDSGNVWLPPVKAPASPETCDTLEWSSELGVLILPEDHNGVSTVSTYTYDGRKLASYTGSLVDVSPSGTKIFLDDDTLIDLPTDRRITLTTSLEYHSEEFYDLFWSSDETRIYRCCYFYADLTTGTSYSSARSDFQDIDNNHQEPWGLVYRGSWIQNDTYFLPEWNWLEDGDLRQLPMLDPAKKVAVEVRSKAGIPEDWPCTDTDVSPDGKYIWMTGFGDSYLVDLITFEAQYYPHKRYASVYWSPNSKFALLHNDDLSDETEPYSVLSVIDKKLKSLPVAPLREEMHWWHPNDNVLIYPSEVENALLVLDATTMSLRKLGLPFILSDLALSPDGTKIAFAATDGRLWELYYPALEDVKTITSPFYKLSNLAWSPDSTSIVFTSGPDIYIAEPIK